MVAPIDAAIITLYPTVTLMPTTSIIHTHAFLFITRSFFFISDDELLSVLGSSDPTSIRVHLLKLFDNVKVSKRCVDGLMPFTDAADAAAAASQLSVSYMPLTRPPPSPPIAI